MRLRTSVALAGLVYLPYRVLLVLSVVVIAAHNLADGVAADQVQWPNLGYADAYIDPGPARHPSGDPRDLRLTDAAVLRRLAG